MQGSAPGSLCSGWGIADRELQLVIEIEVQLQLLVFYELCPYLEDVADTSQLWYHHCQHPLESGLLFQLCLGSRQKPQRLAHGSGRVQMAAQLLKEG